MQNEVLEQQREKFAVLFHKILSFDQNMNYNELYPNFVGLSVSEVSVIDMVAKNPDIILKDISTILGLAKSTLTNIINRLEKKGYLFRTISKQDLRSYGLELTPKGLLTQKEHIAYETATFEMIMAKLDVTEREQLLNLMGKIVSE